MRHGPLGVQVRKGGSCEERVRECGEGAVRGVSATGRGEPQAAGAGSGQKKTGGTV
jgi:hypothetical protein